MSIYICICEVMFEHVCIYAHFVHVVVCVYVHVCVHVRVYVCLPVCVHVYA